MKTIKTCKVGCGKMKTGGPVKKVKKMAKGGLTETINRKGFPLSGPTGENLSGIRTMRNGGIAKMKKSGMVKKMAAGGSLKPVPADKVGLSKLPKAVRNKMGYMKKGGSKKR